MGAGSSVNIERVQVIDNKILRTKMSVIPVNVGVTQSNLQSVQRNEEDLPAVFDDMQMLP